MGERKKEGGVKEENNDKNSKRRRETIKIENGEGNVLFQFNMLQRDMISCGKFELKEKDNRNDVELGAQKHRFVIDAK